VDEEGAAAGARDPGPGAGFLAGRDPHHVPHGWFVETPEAPAYLADHLATVHIGGMLKDIRATGPSPGTEAGP